MKIRHGLRIFLVRTHVKIARELQLALPSSIKFSEIRSDSDSSVFPGLAHPPPRVHFPCCCSGAFLSFRLSVCRADRRERADKREHHHCGVVQDTDKATLSTERGEGEAPPSPSALKRCHPPVCSMTCLGRPPRFFRTTTHNNNKDNKVRRTSWTRKRCAGSST